MKIYKKYKLIDVNWRKSVWREIKLMQKIKHPNIVEMIEAVDTSKYVFLIMDYVGGGSLHTHIKSQSKKRLSEEESRRIFKQVVSGVDYLH